ncbi:MAG: ABC transporter ATP-binding protein [Nocardioidaceae bacterium]|nr:ABC transporter ATP-binding protein [Nocardioidaceae bacterium]
MSAPILELRDVVKTYGDGNGGRVAAVDHVSVAVTEGQGLGIVGESGSGKSTTVRCIVGLEKPDSGTITYDGIDLASASRAERKRFRREVQMVFQDPYSSLSPRLSVEEIVGEGLVVHAPRMSRAQRRDRCVEVLETVGLDAGALPRFPRSFSGGQRQRIAIARALAPEPRMLICDEPVSALDVSVQAQVITLLRRMHRELGLTMLFIAHDLAVVRHLCDSVLVMHEGRVEETGPVSSVYAQPEAGYTRALLDAIPIPDPARDRARRARWRASTIAEETTPA